jgi:hypothetical protein
MKRAVILGLLVVGADRSSSSRGGSRSSSSTGTSDGLATALVQTTDGRGA